MTQPAGGYGVDLSCVFDIDPMGAEVTGQTLLGQALVRRITCPRGRLLSDPNYGYDVTGEINDDIQLNSNEAAQIMANMDQEFLKDERVSASVTTGTFFGGVLQTTSVITSGAGPFSLVLGISSVTVQILHTGQSA